MNRIFYKPDYGWAADAIPYYDNGIFHIFYLLDYRNPEKYGEGTPWFKVTTRDFVNFTDSGEMLKRGGKDEYDMYVFTGSVFKDTDGLYHIWYTGHNTHIVENYIQVVMHAVSRDLEHWEKIPKDTFGAIGDDFEVADWRDPFVWYDEKDAIYKMLLSARRADGAYKRRGETILLTSKDNSEWKVQKSFWQPKLYYAHECPDFFKIGKWYYHVYSEFSHKNLTRYVMSKSPDGPWIQPADDAFDGRAFYAAKTVSDGKNNYIIGWNPTREGESDCGRWQWGGVLETHKLVQRRDGTLSCALPDTVDEAFSEVLPLTLKDERGIDVGHIRTESGCCKVFLSEQAFEGTYMIDVEFTVKDGNRFGVILNADAEKDVSYAYVADVKNGKLTFELFPNHPQYSFDAYGLEREVHIETGKRHRLKIICEQTVCVAYLDNECALSSRMYGNPTGITGLICQGKIEVNSIKIKKQKEKK